MASHSPVANAHPSFIESLYNQYRENPEAINESWRSFFQGFDFAAENGIENGHSTNGASTNGKMESFAKEIGVLSLIYGFRTRGHLLSNTNPIRQRRDRSPHLGLKDHGLSEADLSTHFRAGEEVGLPGASLQDIVNRMTQIYCGSIGFEYTHIEDRSKRSWLKERIESISSPGDFGFSQEKKKRILQKLNGAVIFERFLHTKYIGQKRFSLEGGENAIPALDAVINKAAEMGVQEAVIGMAHRGRLNVLANIMGKTYEQIFNEFEGTAVPDLKYGDGDVKYHLGFGSQVETPSGNTIHLKLAPNPSHLESVDPVVEGMSRAKGDVLYNGEYENVLPILIHGDAAIAGQGVAYETVQMSQLDGYYTGGTIHFVINNQIGFTTDFDDARSSTYCTAAAALVQAPVFHVNGDDAEAVVFAVEMAAAYRQKFNTDVFIDMVCYRKHGHNEGDDPNFTQPEMYHLIKKHPDPREIYSKELIQKNEVDKQLAEEMEKEFWDLLQARLDMVKEKPLPYEYQEPEKQWRELKKHVTAKDMEVSPKTAITKKSMKQIVDHLMSIPDDFNPISKVNRLLKGKQKLLDAKVLDWAMGELLAYGSLMQEGSSIRMSGQDVRRGTFSRRHAVLSDAKTGQDYNRLNTLVDNGAQFHIYNSFLSEFAVLGFEYGYSLVDPNSLVIWEAQFGDFYNGAQTIVDQYVSAADSKWQRQSGLVMLLPHGYEGQGPEHSSARLERFLQMCAEYNMTVANITEPANFFHALRRQLHRDFRKPLVVMSPKSLLRHPKCVSSFDDFVGKTNFQELIDDASVGARSGGKIKRVLMCSGKVYYDLLDRKEKDGVKDIAIVRVEQLYPLPEKQLAAVFKRYKNAEFVWVQEEPENMGGWRYMLANHCGKQKMRVISRKPSASPATGFKKAHDNQQQAIVDEAFAL